MDRPTPLRHRLTLRRATTAGDYCKLAYEEPQIVDGTT